MLGVYDVSLQILFGRKDGIDADMKVFFVPRLGIARNAVAPELWDNRFQKRAFCLELIAYFPMLRIVALRRDLPEHDMSQHKIYPLLKSYTTSFLWTENIEAKK